MKKVKLKVRLNKGKRGISLKKMVSITDEICAFLDLFCKDLSIDIPMENWLATEPNKSSFAYTVESTSEIDEEKEKEFNTSFIDLAKHLKINGRLGKPTYYQYSKIVVPADPDDTVEFGLFDDEDSSQEWFELTKSQSEEIKSTVQNTIEERGAIQGTFHAWYLKSIPPHFTIRELSTEKLVNCYYESKFHNVIHSLTENPNGVIHVSGLITWDALANKMISIKAEKFESAIGFSDQDFEKFFGCAPDITGEMSTGEYINHIRKNGE